MVTIGLRKGLPRRTVRVILRSDAVTGLSSARTEENQGNQ